MSTKKTNATKTNATIDTILNMNDLIELLHKNGVSIASTKNNSSFYRILRGGSSIHIKKRGYIVYTTNDDFELLTNAKLDGVTLENGTNSTDKLRPNISRVDINAIESFIKTIAQNINNQFA